MSNDPIGHFIGWPPDKPINDDDPGAFGDAASHRGSSRPPMLDLELVGGKRFAFPYHDLRATYDPGSGIRLHFSTHTVILRGRSLGPLFDEIVAHAVARIVAVGDRHDDGNGDEADEIPVVRRIIVRQIDRAPRP